MAGVNRVILVGRLGGEPEIRYTANGTSVCTFSLATSEKYNGEERTEWHRITAWGKLADICGQYLQKGSLVYVEGSIRNKAWEDQAGEKHKSTEIHIRDMQMLGGKTRASNDRPDESPVEEGGGFDDIPF